MGVNSFHADVPLCSVSAAQTETPPHHSEFPPSVLVFWWVEEVAALMQREPITALRCDRVTCGSAQAHCWLQRLRFISHLHSSAFHLLLHPRVAAVGIPFPELWVGVGKGRFVCFWACARGPTNLAHQSSTRAELPAPPPSPWFLFVGSGGSIMLPCRGG